MTVKPVILQPVMALPEGTSVGFYATTTLVLQNIYEDDTILAGHELANPWIVDVSGYLPPIYLDGTKKYRMRVILPLESVPVIDFDPVNEFLVIEGTDLAAGAAVANLGFTPANVAGDIFTGNTGANFSPVVINNTDFGFALRSPNIKDTNYHILLSDCGRTIIKDDTTTDSWTIDPHSTTAYPPGFWFRVRVTNTNAVTVVRGSGVACRIAGSATDKDITCAEWCDLIFTCDAVNTWCVVGVGAT